MLRIDRFSQRLVGRRFFYGWIIVAITFATSMITSGIGGYGLSFFVIPMSEDLGFSRTQFSYVSLFRLVALPIVPLLGLLADKRHGPRLMLTFGSILAGLILMATSLVQSLGQFFIIFGALYGLAQLSMGGQLVGPAVLSKWFIRQRGRVMAISAMGISGGGFVVAPIAGWVVGQYDWRIGWAVLGAIMILTIAPMAGLFMRRQPEDMGLLPDGDRPDEGPPLAGDPSRTWAETEYPWTVREALRTRALWVLVASQSFGGLALFPILFHQVAYIQDKGFGLGTATSVATTLAFFAIVGKLVWGFTAEHIHVRWVVPMCLVPAGSSLFLLVVARSPEVLFAYAILHGITMGGWAALTNVAWPSYFGRKHMGAIRGVVTPAGNIVGAFGPVLAGWMWDARGSYDLPFIIFGVSWILAGLVVLLARPPVPPRAVLG